MIMGPLALKLEDRFTYGDYLNWDDDERWELIDGVAYNMSPAPRPIHQRVLADLIRQFATFFLGKPCQVYPAPFDVRLPETDESDDQIATVVQPDLSVICDSNKVDNAGCKGAPDLIIEILSPGTAGRDLKIKFLCYEKAGVREYWIVDPIEKTVQVFNLGENGSYGRPSVYIETDQPHVGIFPGLIIDLPQVFISAQSASPS
jgi:Uma2 family endonuclease